MRSDDGFLVQPKRVAAIGFAVIIWVSTDSVVISSHLKFVSIHFLTVLFVCALASQDTLRWLLICYVIIIIIIVVVVL